MLSYSDWVAQKHAAGVDSAADAHDGNEREADDCEYEDVESNRSVDLRTERVESYACVIDKAQTAYRKSVNRKGDSPGDPEKDAECCSATTNFLVREYKLNEAEKDLNAEYSDSKL